MTTTAPAAEYLKPDDDFFKSVGLTKATLAQMRYKGTGPTFLKPTPRTVLYRRSDVIAWLESSERTITGEDA